MTGCHEVAVLAAPWKKLGHQDTTKYRARLIDRPRPYGVEQICRSFGFPYYEVEHNDVDRIKKIQVDHQFDFAIISGARILKREIVELFGEGILNFHPGKLPETSGLDAFYYAIKRRISQGVTAHFIDSRVDAGMQLFFHETDALADDTPETIQERSYFSQIDALRRFMDIRSNGQLHPLPVNRPSKNRPMSPDEKRAAIQDFSIWKSVRIVAQNTRDLFRACEAGTAEECREILDRAPLLIEARSPEGWTPLIVACYNQKPNIVKMLLDRGADPNTSGAKGTTPLMYAKTKLLRARNMNPEILSMLLGAGADLSRHDGFGKTVLEYVAESGDISLHEWLSAKGRVA